MFDDSGKVEQEQTLRNEGFFLPREDGKEGVRPTKLRFNQDSLVGVLLEDWLSSMAL